MNHLDAAGLRDKRYWRWRQPESEEVQKCRVRPSSTLWRVFILTCAQADTQKIDCVDFNIWSIFGKSHQYLLNSLNSFLHMLFKQIECHLLVKHPTQKLCDEVLQRGLVLFHCLFTYIYNFINNIFWLLKFSLTLEQNKRQWINALSIRIKIM